ncbi:hypothetical protein MPTK1_2g10310 [Marchantia polymorpha subsp. ruderalis]|uniref:40S ribosomal protein S15 n=1 Tax=Marchantia polymorpha TaxID=3197 RepID=A0A2R6XC26_MARPO|nr:hypothetical protein MARPO_0023s0001 [Marchantia polymorpha]BBN01794.1 hypothetical protein Mp_2g10310 [Marchantia polymorpha subsp. ruderalis]|eukprot:PTQ43657.1 hypothetical protein MARPO_0023s0001 [Marchantia polymorpha]
MVNSFEGFSHKFVVVSTCYRGIKSRWPQNHSTKYGSGTSVDKFNEEHEVSCLFDCCEFCNIADIKPKIGTMQPKKRTFKKFILRDVDLNAFLNMSSDELVELFQVRARRSFQRGLKRKSMALIKKLCKAKREASTGEKLELTFNQVEIKPEMIRHYFGEFSISYKPMKHGRSRIGATHSSKFIPLK